MARTFDGIDDQIAFGSDTATDDMAAWTAYALVRPTATITDERQVLTKMDSGFGGKMYIALAATDQILVYMPRNGGVDCYAMTANNAIVSNVWNVVVVTWAGSGSTPIIYRCALGGTVTNLTSTTQVGSGTFRTDATATLRLGARDPLDATFFAGGLADFGLWNRVLSAGEVAALGKGYTSAHFPSGRVASCEVNGRYATELNLNGTNGTVTGTTYLDHPPVTPLMPWTYPSRHIPAVGGSFKAAWARGSNILIGAA